MNDTRVTSYVYDANGNLTSLTNALGQTETKKYDNMNRLVQETDATGAKTTYQYDRKGQRILHRRKWEYHSGRLRWKTAM